MSKRKRMTAQQVMKFLKRSRSGLTSISHKLKPIPNSNPTAEREYWKDEVIKFKETNPVNTHKQRAGKKSRRNRTVSYTELTLVVLDNQAFSAVENPSRTGIKQPSANLNLK